MLLPVIHREFKQEDETYFYRMTGELSLENNGGFIQFRTKIENHPKGKSFKGVRLRVRVSVRVRV